MRTRPPFSTMITSSTPQPRAIAAWLCRWRSSPCTGTAIFGRTSRYISLSSSCAGWPETCTFASRWVITRQPRRSRALCSRPTPSSWPGMTRAEKTTVSPVLEDEPGMGAGGEPRQGGVALPLAAGADQQGLAPRQRRAGGLVQGFGKVGEVAAFARGDHVAFQRRSRQHQTAAGGGGDGAQRLQPGDVRGEGGDRHPLAAVPDDVEERRVEPALGAGAARVERVGGVADQRQHALVADPAQRFDIGHLPHHRVRIQLPVAGVEHGAAGRAQGQRVGFGDRVGEGDRARCRTGRSGRGRRAAPRRPAPRGRCRPRPACAPGRPGRSGWHRPGSGAAARGGPPRPGGPRGRG